MRQVGRGNEHGLTIREYGAVRGWRREVHDHRGTGVDRRPEERIWIKNKVRTFLRRARAPSDL